RPGGARREHRVREDQGIGPARASHNERSGADLTYRIAHLFAYFRYRPHGKKRSKMWSARLDRSKMGGVALTGEGEARLTEFLEWAFLSGVDEDRLKEFRRIAVELFELADGGRINETHILHLIDQHSQGPGGKAAVGLIEDVGEQILRFQAPRKASISPPPSVPMANAPSRPPARPNTSQPFVPRPEERVAGELRPPVAVAPGGDAPGAVVSFATGSAPPPPPTPP